MPVGTIVPETSARVNAAGHRSPTAAELAPLAPRSGSTILRAGQYTRLPCNLPLSEVRAVGDRTEKTMEAIERTLADGTLETLGLVPWSSNYAFVVRVSLGAEEHLAVYKPAAGERPLWDFPEDLYKREVAAYRVSACLGWPQIPPVVARDGPHGPGSVQLYVDNDLAEHFFTIRERPEAVPALQRIALFDALANNADRKGGHVLRAVDGGIWAIDHGLTFHSEPKLRTVIWDWAGQKVPSPWLKDVDRLRAALDAPGDPLQASLGTLLAPEEIDALLERTEAVLRARILPRPLASGQNVPYPLV